MTHAHDITSAFPQKCETLWRTTKTLVTSRKRIMRCLTSCLIQATRPHILESTVARSAGKKILPSRTNRFHRRTIISTRHAKQYVGVSWLDISPTQTSNLKGNNANRLRRDRTSMQPRPQPRKLARRMKLEKYASRRMYAGIQRIRAISRKRTRKDERKRGNPQSVISIGPLAS